MEDFFLSVLYSVKENQTLSYLMLCAAGFFENLIPPVPGDSVVILGALLSAKGYLNPVYVHISTSIGSWGGFYVLFVAASGPGRSFFIKGRIPFIKKEYLEKAAERFGTYGYYLVLFNRFLPGIRSAISVAAGIAGLGRKRVFLLSFLSSVFWNGCLVYGGYFVGNAVLRLIQRISLIGSAGAVVLIAAAVIYLKVIRKKGRTN